MELFVSILALGSTYALLGIGLTLIFGIMVSTVLTLVVIPLLYYAVYRQTYPIALAEPSA